MTCARKAKRIPLVFSALLTAVNALADVPMLPDSFVRTSKVDASGTTWRETGEMRLALSNAVESLKVSFASQGYSLAHDIAVAPSATRRILFWTGPTNDVLAMLWRIDDVNTGVRWGISARGASDNAAEIGKPGDQPSGTESSRPLPNQPLHAQLPNAGDASASKVNPPKQEQEP